VSTIVTCVGRSTASWLHVRPHQWNISQGRGQGPSGYAGGFAETWRLKQLYRSVEQLSFVASS